MGSILDVCFCSCGDLIGHAILEARMNKEEEETNQSIEEEFQRMVRRNDWNATIRMEVPLTTKLVIPDMFRNAVLEEVALEFDKLKNFGDTSQSFAAFVRGMKK